MKHYIDIENLRDEEIQVGDIVRPRNDQAFEVDDTISITEKFDGSCASFSYNVETEQLDAYSRKQPLAYDKTLEGFYNYVQSLNAADFANESQYIVFGEWACKNKIIYNKEYTKIHYIFSIFDRLTEHWMPQDFVKEFCARHNLTYIHELYYGPFVSWEHCKSFMNSPAYGDTQEGVVVRNITKLDDDTIRTPHILKIVNEAFKESMLHSARQRDPEKEAAKADAQKLVATIVTRNRIEKMLLKLRDEGILPSVIGPENMRTVSQNLPKRIYEDCLKEEPEIIQACGEYGGKAVYQTTMLIAKEILL